jgi:putative Holliday junction resolvase
MRFLAIDLGDKRTGIAAGDDLTGIITPLQTIEAPPHLRIDEVMKVVTAHKPDAIVLGVPLNMDSSEGPAAKAARAFGESLSRRANVPVHCQDERLTSYAADQAMNQTGRTHKRKKELRDALAAAEILRDYLDSR